MANIRLGSSLFRQGRRVEGMWDHTVQGPPQQHLVHLPKMSTARQEEKALVGHELEVVGSEGDQESVELGVVSTRRQV